MAKDQVIRPKRKALPGTEFRTNSQAWINLKTKYRAHCARLQLPCAICGSPIDYQLRTGRWAFEADHIKPRKLFPALAYEWNNLQPSHVKCNRSKQAKYQAAQEDTVIWVRPEW